MKRRKWDPKTKALAVLEELKGRPVAKLCNERQISQAQHYQWRDQFLGNAFVPSKSIGRPTATRAWSGRMRG